MENLSLANIICLDIITKLINSDKLQINKKDLSYEILSEFWQYDITYLKLSNDMKILNEAKNNLIRKYGLSNHTSKLEIIQIINYASDKQMDVRLLSVAKQSLNSMDNVIKIIKNKSNKEFIHKKDKDKIVINEKWAKYIKDNVESINQTISDSINMLLKGEHLVIPETIEDESDVSQDICIDKAAEVLEELEKKMSFYQMLDKNKYTCLEAAFEWMNMSNEKYEEYKELYTAYEQEKGIKLATIKYPLVSTLILIYTAVYRYNEEDSSGFWPEFFNGKDSYNYGRDVKIIMEVLESQADKYRIDTSARHYMDKRNLAKVFSHIYLPGRSITWTYNAIYTYYFKNNAGNNIFNLYEFLDNNSYKLDKAGVFFLEKDKTIEDSFLKIIEMFNTSLFDSKQLSKIDNLPIRFIDVFREWLDNEKEELDKQKDDYYIDSPKIKFDRLNEKMSIYFPYQKNVTYSDEQCGWDIKIDGKQWDFIDGRIIRQREGAYLQLDEERKLPYFEKIGIKYIYNNKTMKEWNFENKTNYLIFDEKGYYQKANKVKRDGCIIGIRDWKLEETSYMIESYEDVDWLGYVFYYLNLEDYNYDRLTLCNKFKSITLDIDNEPNITRRKFKLAFEDWETKNILKDIMLIYEEFGEFYFNAPNIRIDNFTIDLISLHEDTNIDYKLSYNLVKEKDNTIKLAFPDLNKGMYYLTVRYRNSIIYREKFVLIDKIIINNEFDMSYKLNGDLERKLSIAKDNSYEIISTDARSIVTEDTNNYYIRPNNTAKAKFGLRVWGHTIPVEKVILPILWNVIGLEDILHTKNNNRYKEITKEVFDTRDIRLNIENYDYRHRSLTYKVVVSDFNSGIVLTETKKLEYGGQFNISFKEFKDRLIRYSNMNVTLIVKTEEEEVLYDQSVLSVIKKIKIYDFKAMSSVDELVLSWDEKYENKSRILKLYNYTKPWKEHLEIELEDHLKTLRLSADNLDMGEYFPVLEFKKEKSIFSSINTEKEFFERGNLNHVFTINNGKYETIEENIMSKILKKYSLGKLGGVLELIKNINVIDLELKQIFYMLLQMQYFVDTEDEEKINLLMEHSYVILTYINKYYSVELLITELFKIENKLSSYDFGYLLNMILSMEKQFNISKETIDKIVEVNTVTALCCIKNGSASLTSNLETSCLESFDHEVLRLAGNTEEILKIVSTEINIINNFWNWINQHRNNYLIYKKYSLSRMFRMYQVEKNITTMKISGDTIDSVVDSIRCKTLPIGISISSKWSNDFNISKKQFNEFISLFKEDMDSSYRQLLYAAFASVAITETSNIQFFKMINTLYLSEQWDLFQRYRAYFKLILI